MPCIKGIMDIKIKKRNGRLEDFNVAKINASAGRDHWPKVFSVLMAGGGIKKGSVYGLSNPTASEPEEDALNVEDWATTIYKCMGITSDKELMAPGDRPIEIVNGGKVRQELLA